MSLTQLVRVFVHESNRIENIYREPTKEEIEAARRFLLLKTIDLTAVNDFQAVVAPLMPLRGRLGMDVRVGDYVCPPGGPGITRQLVVIIEQACYDDNIWLTHCDFEMLHPYMDGNGRTGRILWAWHMKRLGRNPFVLPFLHRWYYQTLENSR